MENRETSYLAICPVSEYTEDTKDAKSRFCMECRSKPRWLDMVLMNVVPYYSWKKDCP